MSQRSCPPPQRSVAYEQPSTDAEQPSKLDLNCPTCGRHLSNVGNLNRHRRDLHRWVKPDDSKTERGPSQLDHLGFDKYNASGPSKLDAQDAGSGASNELPIGSPFPPREEVVDIQRYSSDGRAPSCPRADILSGYFNAADTGSASCVQIETPIPTRLPASTESTFLSMSFGNFSTTPPPCVAHTYGATLDVDIWSRENVSRRTDFSSPVDDGYYSSNADPGNISIYKPRFAHASVAPHRRTDFDMVKGGYPHPPQCVRAPRHQDPGSAAGVGYHSHVAPKMDTLSVPTMYFPPVPPPQPDFFWSEAVEMGIEQQRQAEAYLRQELVLQPHIAPAPQRTARGPLHEQYAGMVRARQHQQGSHPHTSSMHGSQALTRQYAGTHATTHVPTRMDFNQRPPQATTSYPQQAFDASLLPPQSGNEISYHSDQVVYAQQAPSTWRFPDLDPHHHPASGAHPFASSDEFAQYLDDSDMYAPHFDIFNPCSSFH
ncbi:uncharacterized protein SCHCODRAFT_02543503 [Schizophyllum commune H4-8]|nr:uncharacterized protein SCHCODRAFT_02543503 [Schizophyllum commune H4-8]KAI5890907.1 hypothetical protein SCHCODRAFT_02543503 [Schizophyllum commune H4-8]